MSLKSGKLQSFTMAQVEEHNTVEDAWMVVKGWVLDLTYFFPLHPGGAKILLPYLGTDATAVLNDSKIHMHSTSAYRLLKKFRIGYVPGMVSPEKIEKAIEETRNPDDYGVDIYRGLMWQVAGLGEHYDEFIENTYLAPELVTLKYFDNPVLEWGSKSPWYTVPFVWFPVCFFMFYQAVSTGTSVFSMPLFIVGGVLGWMLLEYVLHRFLFHMKTTSFLMNCFHFMLHGYHHIAPMDPMRLTFPPIPAAILASIVYTLMRVFFPFTTTMALLTGICLGYIFYDCEHYLMHHSDVLNGIEYFRSMKRHHLYHHYKNENSNFGISSMLYDHVFQSFDSVYLKGRNRE
eukprot:TRINITY_DN776_c0_g1_i1.p1 TRINITY_DN776_c0_g1~~TRINITY_DN776_c0_g1_i1.p1  ORF type:complete len:357 (-),score=60.52 TRINITY_DN776_c0_g1_i1:32-1066(-)